jgi:hypothetical protein
MLAAQEVRVCTQGRRRLCAPRADSGRLTGCCSAGLSGASRHGHMTRVQAGTMISRQQERAGADLL